MILPADVDSTYESLSTAFKFEAAALRNKAENLETDRG